MVLKGWIRVWYAEVLGRVEQKKTAGEDGQLWVRNWMIDTGFRENAPYASPF